MRILVQVPCKNEELNLKQVLQSIPKPPTQVDQIDVLVIDDSSTDRTVKIAIENGASFVVVKRSHGDWLAPFR